MLFVLFLMLMLLTGTSSFKKVNAVIDERYSDRTVMMYVAQKLRHCETAEVLTDFADNADVTAVALTTYYDGFADTYYIYVSGGYLRELNLFGELSDIDDLSAGMEIIPADTITFEQVHPNLIRVTKGDSSELVYAGGALPLPIETEQTSIAAGGLAQFPDFGAEVPVDTASDTTADTTADATATADTATATAAVTTSSAIVTQTDTAQGLPQPEPPAHPLPEFARPE